MLFTIIIVLFLIIGGVVLTNVLYRRYKEKQYEKMYGGAGIVTFIADKLPFKKDLEKAIGINLVEDLGHVMNGDIDGMIKLLQGLIRFAPQETQESLNKFLNPIFSNIKDVQILVKDKEFMKQFFKTFQLTGAVKDAANLLFSVLGYSPGYVKLGISCTALGIKNVGVTKDVVQYVLKLAHYIPTEKFANSLKELIDKALATNISPRLKKTLATVKKRMSELDVFIKMGKLISNKDYPGALQKVWELVGKEGFSKGEEEEGKFIEMKER
jgi:hypothetical protein